MKPVSPKDVDDAVVLGANIPSPVVEVVNELLLSLGGGQHTILKMGVVIERVVARSDITRAELFANKWLDFEPMYRAAGWEVVFEKPGYGESYDPFWKFVKP